MSKTQFNRSLLTFAKDKALKVFNIGIQYSFTDIYSTGMDPFIPIDSFGRHVLSPEVWRCSVIESDWMTGHYDWSILLTAKLHGICL